MLRSSPRLAALAVSALSALSGCASAVIEPGHRGLLFDPGHGGLQHEILQPGRHSLGASARVDDFPIVYSTHVERVQSQSSEGIPVDVRFSIIVRPIVSELYQLDTEIGQNYYDEVVGPEARSATRDLVATEPVLTLIKPSEKLEDQIESSIRLRTRGKHVEVASVVIESVTLPKEVEDGMQRDAAFARRRAELEATAPAPCSGAPR